MENSLIKLLDESREREIKLNTTLDKLKDELKELKTELKKLQDELKDNEEEIEVLQEANKTLKEEKTELNDSFTRTTLTMKLEKDTLNIENDNQAKRYAKLQEENRELKQRLELLEQSQRRPEQLPIRGQNSPDHSTVSSSVTADDMCSPTSGQVQSSSKTLTEKDLPDLMNSLSPAADVWKMIGTQLRIPLWKLNSIQNANPRSDQNCLMETLTLWLQNPNEDAPCTVNSVNTVLESPSVDKKDLKIPLNHL